MASLEIQVQNRMAELSKEYDEPGSALDNYLDWEDSEIDQVTLMALIQMDGKQWKGGTTPTGENLIRVDDHVFSGGKDGYEHLGDVYEFLSDITDETILQFYGDVEQEFNDEFWESPPPLLHGTRDIDAVMKEGLLLASETRGIGNRSVGDAVFTTTEMSIAEDYGDIVQIDTEAMKRDGYMPFVAEEPQIREYEYKTAMAHMLGVEDWEPDLESGIDRETIIVHGAIPAKYLTRVQQNPASKPHVSAVIIRKNGSVLLLKRASSSRWAPGKWNLPMGHIEPGETPLQAAVRETREESSLKVSGLTHLGDVKHKGAKGSVAYFEAKRFTGRPKIDHESSDWAWVKPGKLSSYDTVPGLKRVLSRQNPTGVTFELLRSPKGDRGTVRAHADGMVVGNLDWSKSGAKYHVGMVYVHPKYRRLSIATSMYKEWMAAEEIKLTDLVPTSKTEAGRLFRKKADETLPNPTSDRDKRMVYVARKVFSGMDPGLQHKVSEFAQGVMAGKRQDLERFASELYSEHEPLRQAMRSLYGPTIRLYRGESQDIPDVDRTFLSWTPLRSLAAQFTYMHGTKHVVREADVSVDDIVASIVTPDAEYIEYLVLNKPQYLIGGAQLPVSGTVYDKANRFGSNDVRKLGPAGIGWSKGRYADSVFSKKLADKEFANIARHVDGVGGRLHSTHVNEEDEGASATVVLPPSFAKHIGGNVKVGPYMVEDVKVWRFDVKDNPTMSAGTSAALSLVEAMPESTIEEIYETVSGHKGSLYDPVSRKSVPQSDVLSALKALRPPSIGGSTVTVYHATDQETAQRLDRQGFILGAKPASVGDYAPGHGIDSGLYVGSSPKAIEGYGRIILKVRVPRRYLEVPTEQRQLGVTDPMEALKQHDGAIVNKSVPPTAFEVLAMNNPTPKKPDRRKLNKLVRQVQGVLTDDLLKPDYRKMKQELLAQGIEPDPMLGHCYVATETLFYLLGGKDAGWYQKSIQHEGGPHWFLRHDSGLIVDATASQFKTKVPYEKGRGIGFQGKPGVPSKRAQEALRRLGKPWVKANPVSFLHAWILKDGTVVDVAAKAGHAVVAAKILGVEQDETGGFVLSDLMDVYSAMFERGAIRATVSNTGSSFEVEKLDASSLRHMQSMLHGNSRLLRPGDEVYVHQISPEKEIVATVDEFIAARSPNALKRLPRPNPARKMSDEHGRSQVVRSNPAEWSDFVRGEYWIGPYGDIDGADLDVGDKGHEAIAIDNLLDKDKLLDGMIAFLQNKYGADEPGIRQKVSQLEALRDDDEISSSNVFFTEYVPDEAGVLSAGDKDKWEAIQRDARVAYARYEGAIQVVGTNFFAWKVTKDTLIRIVDFLAEMLGGEDKLISAKWEIVWIEEGSTGRSASTTVGRLLEIDNPRSLWAIRHAPRRNPVGKPNPTLTARDKKVIDAFAKREQAYSRILLSDGRTLSRMGLGSEDMAVWIGDRIVEVSTESTTFDQTILRYLKKRAKGLVHSGYGQPMYAKGLRFTVTGDVLHDGQWDGRILAYVPGREAPIGYLDYSEYQGRYQIEMVKVLPEYKRHGVATALHKHLLEYHKITPADLDKSMQTEEGYAFRKAVDPYFVKDER